jgi:hypothetical protein
MFDGRRGRIIENIYNSKTRRSGKDVVRVVFRLVRSSKEVLGFEK